MCEVVCLKVQKHDAIFHIKTTSHHATIFAVFSAHRFILHDVPNTKICFHFLKNIISNSKQCRTGCVLHGRTSHFCEVVQNVVWKITLCVCALNCRNMRIILVAMIDSRGGLLTMIDRNFK